MRRVPAKGLAWVLPLLLATAGQGAASSFLALPATPPEATPSIITLGEPAAPVIEAQALDRGLPSAGPDAAAPEIFMLSPSVLAYGADAIPAARNEEVASIGQEADEPATRPQPRWFAEATPLVIRGGVVGEAFPTPAPPAGAIPEEDEPEAEAEPPGFLPAGPPRRRPY